jgi:HlyD family secretion protein
VKKYYRLLILSAAVILIGCGLGERAQEFQFSGTLELTEHSIGARVAGRIASLTVNEGSEVKKGQLLATLDRYEQAQKDFERVKQIFEQGGANQQDVEHAQLAWDDQAVFSPVDGVVLVKAHEAGEVVSAGSAVVVVGDRSSIWVRIYVPEGIINKVKMDQPAELSFDGLKKKFNGHVSFIASQAEFTPRNVQTQEERITQTFAVKITLDNPEPFLRPGVSCDVKIKIGP